MNHKIFLKQKYQKKGKNVTTRMILQLSLFKNMKHHTNFNNCLHVFFSFQDALVFAGRELELQFRMSRPLTDFMATLHKNGVEEKRLSKFVSHLVSQDDVVTFFITFPEEGQYGLDIYTREMAGLNSETNGEKHLLTHCCKYLINSSKRN